MAINEELLDRLRQGVAAWNVWREANREAGRHIEIDLSGADLVGVEAAELGGQPAQVAVGEPG